MKGENYNYSSSSESIIGNLEKIRNQHINQSKEEKYRLYGWGIMSTEMESSGTEAAMQTALVLLRDKKEWLDSVLIIIDPCLNRMEGIDT